jgi:hypothetical protein
MPTTFPTAVSPSNTLQCLGAEEERLEEWRDIPGYEGRYQVSSLGRVKSLARVVPNLRYGSQNRNERIMKQCKCSKKGYLKLGLQLNGKQKLFSVHRLVARAFIPNPNNKSQVNHLNGKNDNSVGSLEWATQSENMKHAYATGLNRGFKKKIKQFTKEGLFIKEFESISSASRFLKIPNQNISVCALGIKKSAGGFVWNYSNLNNND